MFKCTHTNTVTDLRLIHGWNCYFWQVISVFLMVPLNRECAVGAGVSSSNITGTSYFLLSFSTISSLTFLQLYHLAYEGDLEMCRNRTQYKCSSSLNVAPCCQKESPPLTFHWCRHNASLLIICLNWCTFPHWHFIARKTRPAVWDFKKKLLLYYTVLALPQIMHTWYCYKKVAFDVKYSEICFEMYR